MSSNTNIGNTPVNQGYVQLIHTGETGGIDGTLRTLYDGDGTASDLQIASNKVKVSTELFIGSDTLQEYIQDTVGAMLVTNASHTNLSAAYDDAGDGAIDLTATGEVTLTGTQTLTNKTLASPTFTGTANGVNLTLSGDLTVNGTTTTLDTTNLKVTDNLIELNQGVSSNANDSGIIIERGSTGDNAIFMWDESVDKFTLGTTTATGTTTGDITLSSTGTLVASLEGDVTGDVTGNADTATALATARNFSLTGDVTAGAVSFDGSGNVALSTTIAANSVALGTDTTGNYMSDLTEGTGIDITHTPAEGSNATITLDLTEVGFGGGANRLITDDGDGTVTAESGLTYGGSALTLTGDLNISGYIYDSANSGNRLDLDDDSDAGQANQVALYGINHLNLVADNTNNGTGEIRFWNGAVSDLDSGTNTRLMTIDNSGNVTFNAGDVKLGATKKLYLDGGGDSFIFEESANNVMFKVGNNNNLRFNSTGAIFNDAGASLDFRVEGDTDANLLFVDGSADRVGIGTNSPDYELDVAGDIGVDHIIYHNGDGNTYHQFTTDRQRFVVGSELLLDLYEDGTQDYVNLEMVEM